MSSFDFEKSLQRAERRLGDRASSRRPRSDRGALRLPPEIDSALGELVAGQDRPGVVELQQRLAPVCHRLGRRVPARGTIYKFLRQAPGRAYVVRELPPAAQAALYNLTADSVVPGPQLAFYCFNYGDLAAASFAAGLPWLALYQAAMLPGWRDRSRGLLEATLAARGIT